MSGRRIEDDELEERLRSVVRGAQPEVPERLLVFLRGLPEQPRGRVDGAVGRLGSVGGPTRALAGLAAAALVVALVGSFYVLSAGPAGPAASARPSPSPSVSPSAAATASPSVPAASPGASPTPLGAFVTPPVPATGASWTGVDWQQVPAGSPLAAVTSLVRWSGGFVALGYPVPTGSLGRTPVWMSTDGQHWEPLDPDVLGTGTLVLSMAPSGSGLVALTAHSAPDPACPDVVPSIPCWVPQPELTAWTSPDALVWTAHPGPGLDPTRQRLLLSSGPAGMVAAGYGYGTESTASAWATSPDGVTWSVLPAAGALAGFRVADLTYTASGYVAVGWTESGTPDLKASPFALWSTNGHDWTRVALPRPAGLTAGAGPPGVTARGLEVGAAGLIATGMTQSAPGQTIWWRSIDGRSWTLLDSYPPLGAWPGPGAGMGGMPDGTLASDGSRMIAFRSGARMAAWASSDGATWIKLRLTGTAGANESPTLLLLPGGLLTVDQNGAWYGQALGP